MSLNLTMLSRATSLCLMGLTLLLTGCTYSFRSQVTSFHTWPSAAQVKTYIIERDEEQNKNPEYKAYEELLRQRLTASGFTEVKGGETPALKVNFRFGTTITGFNMPAAYYPYYVDSFGRIYPRSAWFYSRHFAPVGYIDPFGRHLAFPINSTYVHAIEIDLVKLSSGEKLAQIKVSSEQLNHSIALYMEDLLASAFVEFPGPNGKVREVTLTPPPKP